MINKGIFNDFGGNQKPLIIIDNKGFDAFCRFLTPEPAEGGGFEPPVQFPVRQFSKLVVSATHPSLLFYGQQK